jgi:hypothetical protein
MRANFRGHRHQKIVKLEKQLLFSTVSLRLCARLIFLRVRYIEFIDEEKSINMTHPWVTTSFLRFTFVAYTSKKRHGEQDC